MNPSAVQNLLPGKRKQVTAYRLVNEEYASSIDEIGISMLWGWRYNPKGEFGVLYLSLSAVCCLKEKIKQAGGKDHLRPQVLGSFEVNVEHCLDLTDLNVLAKLETTLDRLITPHDFTEPQSIAREARRAGFEAILAPAAIGGECTNLILFKDKLRRNSFCEMKELKPYRG